MLPSIPGERQPQCNAAAASHLEVLLFLIRNCLAQATCRCARARSINSDDGDEDDDDHSINTE